MKMDMSSINIDLSLFKNSFELDADIVGKISGILMNGVLTLKNEGDMYKFGAHEADNYSSSVMKYSVFSEENEPASKLEVLELREKLKEVTKFFEYINNERKLFRGIVMAMLQKKFWSILGDEKTNQFFVSKLGGINTELMKKRITLLEASLEEANSKLTQKDKELKTALEDRLLLTKKLEKANADLKRLILDEGKNKTNTLDSNNSNPAIMMNSITMDPPQIQRNINNEYAPSTRAVEVKKLQHQPSKAIISRTLSKKESTTNTSQLQSKETSVKKNLRQKDSVQIFVDEYISPDLDQVETLYQRNSKRPDSTRNRK